MPNGPAGLIPLPGVDHWVSRHALQAALDRNVSLSEIASTITQPEQTWTSSATGTARTVYQRRDIAVVVANTARVIITVLYRSEDQWVTGQGRPSGKALSRNQRRRMTAQLRRMSATV